MKKRIVLITCLMITMPGCALGAPDQPRARNGVLDLRSWSLEKDGSVVLAGELELYWNRLLVPSDFRHHASLSPTGYFTFPQSWTAHDAEKGGPFPRFGCGTYHLKILTGGISKPLALNLFTIGTAYKLYIDGSLVSSAGTVSAEESVGQPRVRPGIVSFMPVSNEIEIIFQVSNYHYYTGGLFDPHVLGLESNVREQLQKKTIIVMLMLGAILLMGLYHLVLYALRRSDRTPLYFAVICIIIFMRAIVQGERFILYLFPETPFELVFKIEFAAWYLGCSAFCVFIRRLFLNEFSRKVLVAAHSVFIPASVFTILAPAKYAFPPVDAVDDCVTDVGILYNVCCFQGAH